MFSDPYYGPLNHPRVAFYNPKINLILLFTAHSLKC